MKRPTRARGDAGFTTYELIAAILLIGIAVLPLVDTLSANSQITADRRERLQAERLMQNETALLESSDPERILLPRSYTANGDGHADPAGAFQVTTEVSFRCGLGGAPSDNADEPLPAGCGEGGVVGDYTVTVEYPRAAGGNTAGRLVHTFSVAARRPHGIIGDMP